MVTFVDDEIITIQRSTLVEMFGEFALQPMSANEDCAPKAAAIIARIDEKKIHQPPPNLGCATTWELINELFARVDVSRQDGEEWPDYRTVDND